jgi:heat shock protein HslJ
MRINQTLPRAASLRILSVLVFASMLPILAPPTQAQGAPMRDLLGTEWLLEDLGGSGVIDNARATLLFQERGQVTGNGSCNNFFASVEIAGDLISFGAIGATYKQCADAVSDQEGRYLTALEFADRMSFDGDYLLVHSKSLEKPLRFARLQKP